MPPASPDTDPNCDEAGREAGPTSRADPLWRRPCRAYVVQARLEGGCRDGLAALQRRLAGASPGVTPCPPPSLHVSLAVLLSVRREYHEPKDALWHRWGQAWSDGLREEAADLDPFEIRFSGLHVSDAAVIAVADPCPPVERLRRRALDLQRLAGVPAAQPSIVHCTLLRSTASGHDLSALARVAAGLEVAAATEVTELRVERELVYPSLVGETVASFPLRRWTVEAPG